MKCLNKAIIIGRLGKDPKLTMTKTTNMPVCMLSIATSRYTKEKGTDKFNEETTWHSVIAFGETAKKIATASKGAIIWVDGRISNRSYTKEDGSKGYTSEIIADQIAEISTTPKAATTGDYDQTPF